MSERRGSWARFRRALYCRPLYEGAQLLLNLARLETMLYTNLGRGEAIDTLLCAAGFAS